LVIALLLFYAGYNLAILFPNPTENSQIALFVLIAIYTSLTLWLTFNVLPNYVKIRKNPSLIPERNYEHFYKHMESLHKTHESTRKAELTKDFSRKLLHFIQFTGIAGVYIWASLNSALIISWGMPSVDFRNYLYFILGMVFVFLFLFGDLVRMTHFEYLPHWAFGLYIKSMEPEREKWTVNAAVPIILMNMFFMPFFIPVQVFFTATFTSCIADAVTSLIGKNFGRHKMSQFGRYPNKTWEGLLAGAFTTFIGVMVIFIIYPVGSLPLLIGIICALVSTAAFIFIDAYVQRLSDNLLNNFIPGMLVWLCILPFI
jgi:CDP-diglyceride synthetase